MDEWTKLTSNVLEKILVNDESEMLNLIKKLSNEEFLNLSIIIKHQIEKFNKLETSLLNGNEIVNENKYLEIADNAKIFYPFDKILEKELIYRYKNGILTLEDLRKLSEKLLNSE